MIFTGDPHHFHEWEFRTTSKYHGTKDEDKPSLGPRVLEGLRDEAYLVAEDLGIEKLTSKDGVMQLIEAMRQRVFPLTAVEAKELYLQGQRVGGPLSRATGEPMLQYIARRKRWWAKLQKLDDKIKVSDNILTDLLLDNARLGHHERLLVLTSVGNVLDFEKVCEALILQHSRIHIKERGGLSDGDRPRERPFPGRTWGKKGKGKRRPYHAHFADAGGDFHLPDEYPEEEEEENDDWDEPETPVAHVAEADPDDDNHWEAEDEKEQIELDVLFAFIANGEMDDSEAEQTVADVAQSETLAYFARKGAKGKGLRYKPGKGKGRTYKQHRSGLSLEDKRRKLAELKSRSVCKACGKTGHWAGDAQCTAPGKGAPGRPSGGKGRSRPQTTMMSVYRGASSSTGAPTARHFEIAEASDDDGVAMMALRRGS